MAKLIVSYVLLFVVILILPITFTKAYNVISFGARPDGQTDSTESFLLTWLAACRSVQLATVYVPRGVFLVKSVRFSGPCKSRIVFQIDGTIVAPWDYNALGKSGFWILFYKVARVWVRGGIIDARGAGFWACRRTKSYCPAGARSITFVGSNHVVMSGLTSLNSHIMHVAIHQCNNVNIYNINVRAPSGSPNTDGIHVDASTGVAITRSIFRTGDDCISMGPGTRNVWIDRIECGPGHGISIGSLGHGLNEDGVQNVTVTSAVFTKTQNGVRIKSWARPSNGFARNIIFRNIIMKKVANPIFIDQTYCPDNSCPHLSSGVQVSQVAYSNIRGTSTTQEAVTFDCSATNPCRGIRMHNIKLTYANRPTTASCINAGGSSSGIAIPKSCL